MVSEGVMAEVREDRIKNLKDLLRHARWEARMVREMGAKWFEIRDSWLIKAWEADNEFLKDNPQVRKALIKALTRDKEKAHRRKAL